MNPKYIQALIIGGLIGGAIILDDFIGPKPHKAMFHKGGFPVEMMYKWHKCDRHPMHKGDKHSRMMRDHHKGDKHSKMRGDRHRSDMHPTLKGQFRHHGKRSHRPDGDQHKSIVISIRADGMEQELVFDALDIPDLVTEELLMKFKDLDTEELKQELIDTFEILGEFDQMDLEFEIESEQPDH